MKKDKETFLFSLHIRLVISSCCSVDVDIEEKISINNFIIDNYTLFLSGYLSLL